MIPRRIPHLLLLATLACGDDGTVGLDASADTGTDAGLADGADAAPGDLGADDAEPGDTAMTLDASVPDVAPSPDVGPDAIAPGGFCDALATALCASRSDCGCGFNPNDCAQTAQSCRDNLFGPPVRDAVQNGSIIYDGRAAKQLVDTLGAAAPACADALETLSWTYADVVDFGGTFRGTLSPGARCTLMFEFLEPNECDQGVCIDQNGVLRCAPIVDLGGTCNTSSSFCVDLSAPIDPRRNVSDTIASACVGFVEGVSTGVCSPRQPVAERCIDDGWCQSLRCEQNACADPLQNGEMCQGISDCTSGYCAVSTSSTSSTAMGLCEPGDAALQAACATDLECASNTCRGGVCVSAACG